jgi:outer membrane protein assembly factor BamB
MTQATQNWWMYHGGPAHGGYAGTGGNLDSATVPSLQTLHTLKLQGPVLSVPAIVDGFVYVGVANSLNAPASNGGAFFKIDIASGEIAHTFNWTIPASEGDTHGFTGMGCTPAVVDGKVYFSAFDGKLYCLKQDDLSLLWVTDLRRADLAHNQPVNNDMGGSPMAAGWSSPVVANGRVYVGMGEGENPLLYGFVFCLDSATGKVVWIFCTSLLRCGQDNVPNLLPADTIRPGQTVPVGFQIFSGQPVVRGCSVWSSIAYDAELNRLYVTTGNPQPEPLTIPTLPTLGYSNGLLSLDAGTGEFKGFFQVLPESNYRVSDFDVDVGGSPTLFMRQGRKVVGFGGKNGGFFILDADTLKLLSWRQLLPYYNDGSQIPTVDPHQAQTDNTLNGRYTNEESNANVAENYSGVFGCAAVDPVSQKLFVGLGGPNYHNVAPGIDCTTTPFMRCVDINSLHDAWPVDNGNPPLYAKAKVYDENTGMEVGMYTSGGECGLSSPAIVNDVVFCSTSKVSLYAFAVADGSLLWHDDLGMQTDGYNGGYGYCLGPAVWGDYVVAGALTLGGEGGLLRIYGLAKP